MGLPRKRTPIVKYEMISPESRHSVIFIMDSSDYIQEHMYIFRNKYIYAWNNNEKRGYNFEEGGVVFGGFVGQKDKGGCK